MSVKLEKTHFSTDEYHQDSNLTRKNQPACEKVYFFRFGQITKTVSQIWGHLAREICSNNTKISTECEQGFEK